MVSDIKISDFEHGNFPEIKCSLIKAEFSSFESSEITSHNIPSFSTPLATKETSPIVLRSLITLSTPSIAKIFCLNSSFNGFSFICSATFKCSSFK